LEFLNTKLFVTSIAYLEFLNTKLFVTSIAYLEFLNTKLFLTPSFFSLLLVLRYKIIYELKFYQT